MDFECNPCKKAGIRVFWGKGCRVWANPWKTLQPLEVNNSAGFRQKVVGFEGSKGFSYIVPGKNVTCYSLYTIIIFSLIYSNKPYNPTTLMLKLNNDAGLGGCRVYQNPWKTLGNPTTNCKSKN